MALSLDGNISYIGTEFIKLLNTGSSHLATVEYVDNAVVNGGGGGGGDGYTQAEVDTLLNNKLNVNNPQDITGNLRLDPTNGLSKIILNAVSPPNASDDFYCNGSAHINGTLRVSLLTSDGDLNADGVNADVFNSNVIANDIVFNHNDVEYMRFNVSDDEIQISKNIELNEDLIMKSTKVLYLDATSNLLRYITSRNDNGQDILELVNNKATNNQIRFTNNGSTSLIVDNSFVYTPRQIQGDNGLKVDFIDTRTANANFDFRRNNVSYITFQSDRVDINQALHLANSLTIDVANKLTMAPSLEGGVNIFDIRNLRPVADNPMIRFRVGEGGGETIVCEMSNDAVSFQRNVIVGTAYELRTNVIDTVNDSDLVFKRNDVQFMTLDKFTEDVNGTPTELEAIICSKQLRANGNIRVNNLQINQFSSGVQYTDFRLHNADSVMRFYVGNSTSANFQITNAGITLGRETTISSVKTNIIDTNGDTDLIVRRNGDTFLTLDDTDGVKASQSITVEGANDFVYTNNLRHNTGTDLNIWTLSTMKFYSNAVNKMEIKQTQIDINEDVVFGSGKGLTVPEIFTYNYDTNGTLGDVVWAYNNTSYMYYDQSDTRFGFLVDVISNNAFSGTAFNVVSDEQKKENIEDAYEDCSEIVKKIKVKTFNYKEDKKKKKNIGFITQDVIKKVPTKFEAVVNDYGDYMGLDYGKMSSILWKALQEEMAKTEYLESKLFETIARVEALEKTKPKTKAKSEQLSRSKSSLGQSPKPEK